MPPVRVARRELRGLLLLLVGCAPRPAVPASSSAAAAPGAPILRIDGDFDPTRGWPELVLAPQVRCDGGAVLVPLERVYGGERHPVAAAILDRAGRVLERLDLDAVIDGFDGRDATAVHRKLAAANAHLATQCWRPMPPGPPETSAIWAAPALAFTHRGATTRLDRPDLVLSPAPDDDCVAVARVAAVQADDTAGLGLVGIRHEMHDNCGSDPWDWIVVPLPALAVAPPAFLCGAASQDAFATEVERRRSRTGDTDQPFGSCTIRLEGEVLSVHRGEVLVFEDKEAGASMAYDPAFVLHGIRPAQDAAVAAASAARAGFPTIDCDAAGAIDACRFTSSAHAPDACGAGGIYVLLRHAPGAGAASEIHDAADLRGRSILAIALAMPC